MNSLGGNKFDRITNASTLIFANLSKQNYLGRKPIRIKIFFLRNKEVQIAKVERVVDVTDTLVEPSPAINSPITVGDQVTIFDCPGNNAFGLG